MRATLLNKRVFRLTDALRDMTTSLNCGAKLLNNVTQGTASSCEVVRLMPVFGSELLGDSGEPLPGILYRQEHNFFALRFGKKSSSAEHGEGGQ